MSVRDKATRLPGKVLKPLGDCNVTEFLLRRLRTVRNADVVVLATSTDPQDGVLVDIAAAEGVPAFRGSKDDKLLRYRDAARAHALDFAVIVDGDDPFVSARHIAAMIDAVASEPADYTVWEGLPLGASGFGVGRAALEKICDDEAERDTEIWGHLFTGNPDFVCRPLREDDPRFNRPDIRMTLDYPEDLSFFTAVVDGLAAAGREPTFENVMDFLGRRPDVVAINAGLSEKYESHLESSRAGS